MIKYRRVQTMTLHSLVLYFIFASRVVFPARLTNTHVSLGHWNKLQVRANVATSWSKSSSVYTLRTEGRLQNIKHFCNLPSFRAPKFPFWGIFHHIHVKHFPRACWRFQKCPLPVLERCPRYGEHTCSYSKTTEKGQGPTPGFVL